MKQAGSPVGRPNLALAGFFLTLIGGFVLGWVMDRLAQRKAPFQSFLLGPAISIVLAAVAMLALIAAFGFNWSNVAGGSYVMAAIAGYLLSAIPGQWVWLRRELNREPGTREK